MNVKDHRYNKMDALLKSNTASGKNIYPHVNTLSQVEDKFYDWYSIKTDGFDELKVIVSSVRSKERRAIFDPGLLGCGHKGRAFIVNSKEDGLKLENFINNSKIMDLLEEDGKSGFSVPIFRLKNIPRSWVDRFNKGEML
jgi:hypothetical protein